MSAWDSVSGFFKDIYKDAGDGFRLIRQMPQAYAEKFEEYSSMAKLYAQRLGINTSDQQGHNNDFDAFRHAFTSAMVVKEYGENAAKAGGVFHEFLGRIAGQPEKEANMDIQNNRMGVQIGKVSMNEGWNAMRVAQETKKSLENGQLIRKPQQEIINDRPSILDYYKRSRSN